MAKAWEKKVGLADHFGTVATVSFDPADEDFEALASVELRSGGGMIRGSATPEALRQLAAAYLDAADALEGSQ